MYYTYTETLSIHVYHLSIYLFIYLRQPDEATYLTRTKRGPACLTSLARGSSNMPCSPTILFTRGTHLPVSPNAQECHLFFFFSLNNMDCPLQNLSRVFFIISKIFIILLRLKSSRNSLNQWSLLHFTWPKAFLSVTNCGWCFIVLVLTWHTEQGVRIYLFRVT